MQNNSSISNSTSRVVGRRGGGREGEEVGIAERVKGRGGSLSLCSAGSGRSPHCGGTAIPAYLRQLGSLNKKKKKGKQRGANLKDGLGGPAGKLTPVLLPSLPSCGELVFLFSSLVLLTCTSTGVSADEVSWSCTCSARECSRRFGCLLVCLLVCFQA